MAEFRLLGAIEDDDEMLLLAALNETDTDGDAPTFNLDNLTDEQCTKLFRFEKEDIKLLFEKLKIPAKIECQNQSICSGLEGLCILLRGLVYPNRLVDLHPLFGRSKTAMSFIVKEVLDFVYETHGHLLSDMNRSWLSRQNLQEFANAIQSRGCPLPNCWGFIDGTVRPICRPSRHQRIVFSGHKRVHAMKFQSIVAPNGLIANMFGPLEGRRHDAGMLRESNLQEHFENNMITDTGDVYALYGDSAYPLTPFIFTPFRGGVITANQARFNRRMSSIRSCVEWTFGKIVSLFAFVDYKKNLKLYLKPIGKYYLVAALLTNCHTCMYGSETAEYFGLEPPSLQGYLLG